MSARAADVSLAFSHVPVIATTSRLLVVTKSEKDADFWRIDLTFTVAILMRFEFVGPGFKLTSPDRKKRRGRNIFGLGR